MRLVVTRLTSLAAVVLVWLLAAPAASAQWLAGEPVRLFDGRLRLAGEVSATIGAQDDDAFFNYTDYERNALRTVRIALTSLWQPTGAVAVLVELRADDFDHLTASAAYVRLRPVKRLPLDLQAGRIPPVFGAFARAYGTDRLLIGYPLAYQYLTSLRADALPADAGDLLRMRARGWRTTFPIGDPYAGPGLPLVSALRWDTGVQARWTADVVETAVSITQGTLSNPRLEDDNGSLQVAGRVAVRPAAGLVLGASAARGGWISDDVPVDAGGAAQEAIGGDVEYSAGHWILRAETVWSRWRMPFETPPPEGEDLSALAAWAEGRYRVTPRLDVAARIDRLSFSRITPPGDGSGAVTWDAPVTRLEFGAGYALLRNLRVRGVVQVNDRDGGRVRRRTLVSSQVSWWF